MKIMKFQIMLKKTFTQNITPITGMIKNISALDLVLIHMIENIGTGMLETIKNISN